MTETNDAAQTAEAAAQAPKSTGAIIGIIAVALVVLVAISAIGGNVAAAIMGPAEANNEEGPVAAQEQPAAPSAPAQAPEVQAPEAAADSVDPSAVAAVVNGQSISEQTITDYIASFRASMGLDTDDAWGEWMATYGYTPETVREEVIEGFVLDELYNLAAQELNVQVTQEDIDQALEDTKSQFETDEEYQQALADAGMTEESYIQNDLMPILLEEKIMEAAIGDEVENGDDGTEGDDGTLFYEWLENYKQLKGVKVNPMPDGLPYVVDMTLYEGAVGDDELDLDAEELMLEDEDGNPVAIEDLEMLDEEEPANDLGAADEEE